MVAADEVAAVLVELEALGSQRVRDQMSRQFGIVTADRVLGVPMASIQKVARPRRERHNLAEALWDAGVYEARMVACMVDDIALVSPEQMDRWRADFDNWAVCDTVCFKLWDRSPHAFDMIRQWAGLNEEFGKRAAFALLASVARHVRTGPDQPFLEGLTLIEAAATDDRNFVKKGVNWALRAIGGKADPTLRAAARETAQRLATSKDRTARWIGKDAMRAFARADAKREPTT
ncbi:MAG TPA: DNA alkylation repair protein [Caulobacter sp.]|nr:DNA alkylation repair protein [Caulobacter sp.]